MKEEFKIVLGKKVGEKHLDELIDEFYQYYCLKGNSVKYIFDFSDVEWMSNEELLTLTGLFKSLIDSEIEINICFLKDGSSESVNSRKAIQFVQLWDVWKIYLIVPHVDFNLYFDIDSHIIDRLKEKYQIKSVSQEIYESYGVTPFVTLEKIKAYDDRKIIKKLENTYRLEAATNEILRENKCFLPFQNETLSSIITKELYENFLDHYTKSVFGEKSNLAFLSLVLKRSLNKEKVGSDKIQSILKQNFKEESIPELIDFFVDKKNPELFLNRSVLQLSFLDFGEGIPTTLKQSYLKNSGYGYSKKHKIQNEDTRIIEYAFNHSSSQHELKDKYKEEFAVPRGLFDLLSIVKRFEGIIIARSNFGRIAFDFSHGKSIDESVRYFGDSTKFFPGTLFTIYIPERELISNIDSSSIKPYESLAKFSFNKNEVRHISLFEIQSSQKTLGIEKKDFYNELFTSFLNKIENNFEALIYLDFTGWEIDERVTRKIIFFLCTDYRVNLKNNVVAINPPSKSFLASIRDEILALNEIDRKFKIHPTPFVFFTNDDLEIFWLGIFAENDIIKLNKLLFEEHDLRKSDFENPDSIIGHINGYDDHGNLLSIINSNSLLSFYKKKALEIEQEDIRKIIDPCLKKEKDSIYLCNGNYYQYEYLQLFDALSNAVTREFLNDILLRKIQGLIGDMNEFILVGITSSSHKLIDFFEAKNGGDPKKYIRLNNYFSFDEELEFKDEIKEDAKVILLCDVISTGYLVKRFESSLNLVGASLEGIGVLVDAIDEDFEPFRHNSSVFSHKIISVYQKILKKYTRKDISEILQKGKLRVTRINPFTNTPIIQMINQSNYGDSVLLSNKEFVELILVNQIRVGYFSFNSLVHPYFFDMHSIMNDESNSEGLINMVFKSLQNHIDLRNIEIVFYPKASGIQNINFELLQDKFFKSHDTKFFELERFSTYEGWRFPHPPQSLIDISNNKNVMILDDGSCSGESIYQMIDEVAFLNVQSIVVLSIVGRVSDHKREFFSRIKNIDSGGKNIPVRIFFGSNWHIPTYHLSKSPVIEENKWLDQLTSLPNVPYPIKSIVNAIKHEITPRKISKGDSSYLLKNKDGSPIHNELALVRDELGKISEYRFYIEYFKYFDDFISYHESKKSKERGEFPYRKIETLCAVFLHEPYLYERVKIVVPDIIERIEEFVKLFVIEQQIPFEKLHYDWSKKDMVHLLFIVYRNEALLNIINEAKFKKLLIYLSDNQSTLNYILYKLLKYFPLTKTEVNIKRFDNEIKELIEKVNTGNDNLDKHVKKFYNFLKTLPSRSDIESHLKMLKENYDKEKAPEQHDDKISFNHNISLILGQIRGTMDNLESGGKVSKELSEAIIKSWFQLMNFISPILTFSISYEDYLAPYPYFKLINYTERDSDSLRSMVGTNEELIFSLNESFGDLEKLKLIERNIIKIQANFCLNSEFHELIENRNSEWEEFLTNFLSGLDILEIEFIGDTHGVGAGRRIKIPKSYSQKLIVDELLTNLRNHCKKETKIQLEIKETLPDVIHMEIINSIAEVSYTNSNGEGTKCLNLLSSAEYFGFNYKAKIIGDNYHQTIKFDLI